MISHLADLESDLSRFHRVDDMYALDGPHFFRLVWRLSTYGGVIAMRLEEQQSSESVSVPSSPQAPSSGSATRSSRPLSAFMVMHPDLIEKRKVGASQ